MDISSARCSLHQDLHKVTKLTLVSLNSVQAAHAFPSPRLIQLSFRSWNVQKFHPLLNFEDFFLIQLFSILVSRMPLNWKGPYYHSKMHLLAEAVPAETSPRDCSPSLDFGQPWLPFYLTLLGAAQWIRPMVTATQPNAVLLILWWWCCVSLKSSRTSETVSMPAIFTDVNYFSL